MKAKMAMKGKKATSNVTEKSSVSATDSQTRDKKTKKEPNRSNKQKPSKTEKLPKQKLEPQSFPDDDEKMEIELEWQEPRGARDLSRRGPLDTDPTP